MHADKFWKFFWAALGGCLGVYLLGIAGVLYVRPSDSASREAAVGAAYDSSKDPFQKDAAPSQPTTSPSDYLYRESLPLGFEDWSWKTSIDWRSSERKFEGSYSLHAMFTEPGADIQAHTPVMNLSQFNSLSLAVYPESVQDLYIELYNAAGEPISKQSIGWYAAGGALTPDAWNLVSIPLIDLVASSSEAAPTRSISGFSIISDEPGSAFIDTIQFNKYAVSHSRWEDVAGAETPAQP